MAINQTSALIDVAFAVCTALAGHGTTAVLVVGELIEHYDTLNCSDEVLYIITEKAE